MIMQIVVNGKVMQTRARNLDELCAELGHGEAKVATALNGAFVPRPARAGTCLGEGDRVEIVAPQAGG